MPEHADIRDVCVCGRRYRIRNAYPGFVFTCPDCGRVTTITQADIDLAAPEDNLAGVMPTERPAETEPPRDAILVDGFGLRLAPQGSKVGDAGKVLYETEEAKVAGALGLSRPGPAPYVAPAQGVGPAQAEVGRARRRSFLEDVGRSFVLCGSSDNVIKLSVAVAGTLLAMLCTWALTAMTQAILAVGAFIVPFAMLFVIIAWALVHMYIIHVMWLTLTVTVDGEDELPLAMPIQSIWDEVFMPAFRLLAAVAVCLLPAILVWWFLSGTAARDVLQPLTLLFGAFLFPVALMGLGIGQSIFFLRPDWLVRCIIAIGPIYIVPWAIVMLMLLLSHLLVLGLGAFPQALFINEVLIPVVLVFLQMYLGYVLFRTVGLMYRHFRDRLPGQF